AVSFSGYATRTCCGRIYTGNDNLLLLYTTGDYTLPLTKAHTFAERLAHKLHLMEKMKLGSTAELVRYAVEHKLFQD
ncbi:MAG: hypothetical protein Q7U37_08810, partial [Gallionella sp.]|nr:hypothetical protein [Gallionella sp.]